jgi:putative peptidoglycan lipid II flippase
MDLDSSSVGGDSEHAQQALSAATEANNGGATGRRIARSTLVVMLSFAVAKGISLAQTFIIADVFGAGQEWDAFVTANRIPELIFTLIAGGALSFAFIPVFSKYLAIGVRERAWQIASSVINSFFLISLFASVVAFVTAPWIVSNVVAPGFDSASIDQTVHLMRLLLLGTLVFSVSGTVMGILQSHNHFLLPALAPIMYDLGILFGVIVLIPRMGLQGIAIGAILGAVLHLGIQVPGLIHYRARWWPRLGLREPEFWHIVRLMIPRVLGLGVFSLNIIIMNNIASRLGTGSVSALDWGWRLTQIPQTLLGTAMGIVIFPTLAALSASALLDSKRSAMSGALRFIIVSTIPAAFGLIAIGRPLVRLLERGAFDSATGDLVYATIIGFSIGLVAMSVLEVAARSFYADQDTWTPLWAALVGSSVNLVLSLWLSGILTGAAMLPGVAGGVAGLALANSLGILIEVGILLAIQSRRWAGIQEARLLRTLARTTFASTIMATGVIGFSIVWGTIVPPGGFALDIMHVFLGVIVGGLLFLGAAILLRMEEVQELAVLTGLRRVVPA